MQTVFPHMEQRAATNPVVWMFAGQGSQYYQMGRDLYSGNDIFRQTLDALDTFIKQEAGFSVVTALYADEAAKSTPFDQTKLTHPALLMVQYSLGKTLIAEGFTKPDYILGASLGEFIAATYAGSCPPEQMLLELISQAEILEKCCQSGAMIAILDSVELYHRLAYLQQKSELAGISFDKGFLVAVSREETINVLAFLERNNIMHQKLPVSIAFHSSNIDSAQKQFMDALTKSHYATPEIPVVSCLRRESYTRSFSSAYFWEVIRQPIQFMESFEAFSKINPDAIYLDLSPSGTLANFSNRCSIAQRQGQQIALPLMSPFGESSDLIRKAKALFL